MTVKVILNPYANRWRARRKIPALQAALDAAGVSYELVETAGPTHGIEVARQAALDGYDAVVAAGGDGTVSEVVNGLIHAAGDGPTCPLGVLPVGTGNDFNDMVGLPRDLRAAADVIAAGKTRRVDAGRVNDRYFDNNCALGMEPLVTIENIKIKRLSGNSRYIAALVKALLKLTAWEMRITWDDGEYQGPAILLSVCNGPRTGGMFYMSPDARMDDGLFDFVYAPDLTKWQVMTILPRLFNGSHIRHPKISHGRTRRLTIESRPGTPIHADGEVIAEAARRIEYEVLPEKLTVLVP